MKRWTILFLSMMACSDLQDGNTTAEPETTSDTAAALTSRTPGPASPEMLAAALTGDPDLMAAAIGTAAACHASFDCDPNRFSCGTWSSWANCGGQFCTPINKCTFPPGCDETDPNCQVFPRFAQNSQQFSVCWTADRKESCTSWHIKTTPGGCGCGSE